ncbi:growth arrest and DNA damage-inducible protein GADD45 gamma-like [Physella acuta]|uniref:growth arrest and DNA damage-inducible protein GADD45 gamma-like n=1 Tax=Physella acuta TaxID=109671 RepID=UPI0027DB7A98|nr:growth arrest and DNA damage-inducible protein GADD45 gamma-like [Physella acuta]
MTLPDTMDKENSLDIRKLKAMGHTIRTCVKQAIRRQGLTCGMKACGELLQSNPGNVMMCVLPTDCNNISIHIHQTLIQAFCKENNILVVELKDDTALATLISKLSEGRYGHKVNGRPDDTSCLLLQYPKRGPSKEDELVFKFYEMMMKGSRPLPHLALPD